VIASGTGAAGAGAARAPRRTLLRLPNWVGDTLLALPALEALAALDPAGAVFSGRPAALDLARHLAPESPRVELAGGHAPRRWLAQARLLRASGCSRGLLLTPSLSSALQLWAAGLPERIGWAEQGRGPWLTCRAPRLPRGSLHLAEEFKDLARLAGAEGFAGVPELPPDGAAAAEAGRLLADVFGEARSRPLVALCPGARYGPAKQWPLERFVELARELRGGGVADLLVVGAEPEREAGAALLAGAGGGGLNACGAGPILFSAELLRRAQAVVCNDSGAMHLAAAVGTPVVALFGPTDPRWTGPQGPRHQIVRGPCPLAPCFRRRCPLGVTPPPCMAAIRATEVLARIRSLLDPRAHPAAAGLFLDRDGTLIELEPYLCDPQRVRLIPGAAGALRRAREAGYRLVVASNQSGVARGLYGDEAVRAVEARVRELLETEGVTVDGFYHCPHHPEHTGRCQCRKPAPGMLLLAARELGLDLDRSFMVGDTPADLQAGAAAGCRSLLVRTGYGGRERERGEHREALGDGGAARPAASVESLEQAVEAILAGRTLDPRQGQIAD